MSVFSYCLLNLILCVMWFYRVSVKILTLPLCKEEPDDPVLFCLCSASSAELKYVLIVKIIEWQDVRKKKIHSLQDFESCSDNLDW